ncbi:nucleoside diphosphate kinase regulator [Microvirga subterranea]|uniref:nucleoside diphosphate kinase regulator n=1 Tax=Microvirga subterranea TaxID=186651 RepID=UPI001FDF43DB|nr:nucleoside diphosphate kinase regulator [Microvirga subterranea]
MSTSVATPIVSSIDHARLRRIALAGMQIRRSPPSAHFLAEELERARVVGPAYLPPNVISMHSVFDFRDGVTKGIRRAMLVYPGEEDEGLGRISVLSPLGAALIGLSERQSFQWRSATGVWRTLHVARVVRQPERASECDEHRDGATGSIGRMRPNEDRT